jgi:hypothetical protein
VYYTILYWRNKRITFCIKQPLLWWSEDFKDSKSLHVIFCTEYCYSNCWQKQCFILQTLRECNTVHTRCLYVRISLYTTDADTLQRLCHSWGGWSQQASHYSGPGSITGHSSGICDGINGGIGEDFCEYFRFSWQSTFHKIVHFFRLPSRATTMGHLRPKY